MVRIKIPGAVGGVIKGGGVLDDIADFIRNPPPTPVGGAIGRAGQQYCDYLSAAPALAFGILQSQGFIGAIVCQPYYDDSGFSPPEFGPPDFTGGQCEGVNYRIQGGYAEFFGDCSTAARTFDTTAIGPVGPLRSQPGSPNCPDADGVGFEIGSASGFLGLTGTIQNGVSKPTVTVTRLDGNPDDCGDIPGDLVPGPNPAPLPPGYQPGIDFGIDDDGDPFFEVPGVDNPLGDPIPFDDPFAPIAPPATPPQPNGDNSPGEPDAIGNPIGDGVAGDMGEDFDFGEPPMGKIWVGCLVEFSVNNAYGNIPNTGPENTVYPLTVGNISLRYGNLRGTSNQVRSRFTELFRPNTALEVTGAFVQTRPNTSAIVRPISVTVCKETQCSGE